MSARVACCRFLTLKLSVSIGFLCGVSELLVGPWLACVAVLQLL